MPEDIVYKPTSEYSGELDTPKQTLAETITERLLKHGIVKRGSALFQINGDRTIYTVPEGRTFFLIHAMLGLQTVLAGFGQTVFHVADGQQILKLWSTSVLNSVESISASLSIPIKLNSGEILEINSNSANVRADGSFAGYEIDNEFLK